MERIIQATLFAVLGFVVFCNGEFYIASSPKAMKFTPSYGQTLRRREISGVINFLMGLSSSHLHRTESWPGMKSIDIFNPPKINVLITLHVPEGNKFELKKHVMKYATDELPSRVDVFELNSALRSYYDKDDLIQTFALAKQFQGESFGSVNTEEIRRQLSEDDSILNDVLLKARSLSKDRDTDLQVFAEIQMLKDAVNNIVPAEYDERQSIHLVLTSLDALSQEYGAMSTQVKEAILLFEQHISEFIEAAEAKFKDQMLCEVDVMSGSPTVPEYLVRHSRSLLQDSSNDSSHNITLRNIATPNSANYAVIFNICLWLMIGFFIAAFAAAYSMWDMDPGKDNIIYRVTSQRMKTD